MAEALLTSALSCGYGDGVHAVEAQAWHVRSSLCDDIIKRKPSIDIAGPTAYRTPDISCL